MHWSTLCAWYGPKGIHISSIPDLRWYLFCKHLAESSKLPPTVGALEEHIERVWVQSRVWCQATGMRQNLFDQLQHGYYLNFSGKILPTTTRIPPAPQTILEMVRCHCKTHCTTQRCSCRRHNLACTELCLCGECENDEDCYGENDSEDSEEEL